MQRSFIGAAVGALALFSAACESPSTPTPTPIAVSVTVTPASLQLQTGQVANVTAVVENAINPAVVWRSANPAIASVNNAGAVTGVSAGSTIVTAISVADTMKRATATVTVTGTAPPPPTGPVSIPVLGLGAVTDRWTAEVAVRGNFGYTSTWNNRNGIRGNALKIWNISGDTPVLVDTIAFAGQVSTTGDVQISDDGTLLVVPTEGTGSLRLLSMGTPGSPKLVSTWTHPEANAGVHTVKLGRVNGRHYAFLSINPSSQPARLLIVDITDPVNPSLVWSQAMGRPYVHDVFVRDGILMTALWHDGLRIYDIGGGGRGGSPSAPVVMGSIPTTAGYIHNIWWFHDSAGAKKYVFLGEENTSAGGFGTNQSKGDVHVIDVSDMSNPRQVAQYTVTGAGSHNFSMDEQSGILYAAFYNGGVRALDVRGDLGTCTAAQKLPNGHCDLRAMGREAGIAALPAGTYIWGVAWQDGYVYASDMREGLYKLDARALRR
ncbi:MAG TPA: Ig-like domain-containing protein [Longimicrobiales bacterium]|nr:Ig-like domain-containing protein [Longimicrobiales bacterium]